MIQDKLFPRSFRDRERAGKVLLAAAASLILAVPGMADAQDQRGGHGREGGPPSGGHAGAPGHGGPSMGQGQRRGGPNVGAGAVQGRALGGAYRHGFGGGPPPSAGQFGPGHTFRGYDGSEQRDSRGNAGDRRGFGDEFRSARRFHGGGYQRPSGWYAHRWRHGDILPPLFWAEDYWLLDYWLYGLSPPPYGYVWVRVGNDSLLIDRYTGEVVEVIYGVFY